MRKTEISARWTGEKLNYVGIDSKGNEIKMGGDNVSPSQMILLGWAGCMGMDVISILQKKRQKITDVQIKVIGQQPNQYPRPIQHAEIALTVIGEDIDSKAVERAIDLSANKYCIVGQTLQNPVTLTTSFTVEQG